jgi:hypothetical protein
LLWDTWVPWRVHLNTLGGVKCFWTDASRAEVHQGWPLDLSSSDFRCHSYFIMIVTCHWRSISNTNNHPQHFIIYLKQFSNVPSTWCIYHLLKKRMSTQSSWLVWRYIQHVQNFPIQFVTMIQMKT